MAVVISMIKSDKYDNEIIKKVQIDLKKTYGEYHKIKEVPLYLKYVV